MTKGMQTILHPFSFFEVTPFYVSHKDAVKFKPGLRCNSILTPVFTLVKQIAPSLRLSGVEGTGITSITHAHNCFRDHKGIGSNFDLVILKSHRLNSPLAAFRTGNAKHSIIHFIVFLQ